MFKSLLTYQQVDPSFLDTAYTFGDQDDPKDLCLMSFRSGDTLGTPADQLLAIPELGRSGREIHMSYLLRSVEAKKNRPWPWQIRQAAVYHSFDVDTGRSFWLSLKGNDVFDERVRQGSPYLNLPSDPATKDVASCFRASLATHLIYLSWCDENWRQYVNDVEANVCEILEKAQKAPIDEHVTEKTSKLAAYPRSLRETRSRTNSAYSKRPSRPNTGLSMAQPRKQTTWEIVTGAASRLSAIRKKTAEFDPEKAAGAAGGVLAAPADDSESDALIDVRQVLSEFRFTDMQTLSTCSDRTRRAQLTLTLNISVLNELYECYHRLLTAGLPTFGAIRTSCAEDLAEFLRELQSLIRRLETRRSQLECVTALLAESKELVSAFASRNLQITANHRASSTTASCRSASSTSASGTRRRRRSWPCRRRSSRTRRGWRRRRCTSSQS
jgi:hypothetical protein